MAFLTRNNCVTNERVDRRGFWRAVVTACDIRDSLFREGIINPNSPPEQIKAAIAQRYAERFGG